MIILIVFAYGVWLAGPDRMCGADRNRTGISRTPVQVTAVEAWRWVTN